MSVFPVAPCPNDYLVRLYHLPYLAVWGSCSGLHQLIHWTIWKFRPFNISVEQDVVIGAGQELSYFSTRRSGISQVRVNSQS